MEAFNLSSIPSSLANPSLLASSSLEHITNTLMLVFQLTSRQTKNMKINDTRKCLWRKHHRRLFFLKKTRASGGWCIRDGRGEKKGLLSDLLWYCSIYYLPPFGRLFFFTMASFCHCFFPCPISHGWFRPWKRKRYYQLSETGRLITTSTNLFCIRRIRIGRISFYSLLCVWTWYRFRLVFLSFLLFIILLSILTVFYFYANSSSLTILKVIIISLLCLYFFFWKNSAFILFFFDFLFLTSYYNKWVVFWN